MLIDKNGREFDPKKLHKNRSIREAQLRDLREVFVVRPKHADFFKVHKRARLVG